MSDRLSRLECAIVLAHPEVPEADSMGLEIGAFLDSQGLEITNGFLGQEALSERILNGEFDLVVALGGDGTMLRAGHLCGPSQVPLLGINLGRFGFLMEVRQNEWREVLPRLFAGEYWLERRMMLCAEQIRSGEVIGRWEVLNEVVVGRGQAVRPVQLITEVDGRYLTTYVADALIASTATGSTAYALAAGGPILPPELRSILLVAVAPHLSIDRAIVLAEGSSVHIKVLSDHTPIMSLDGQTPVTLGETDSVLVRASDHSVDFVRFQDPGYFYRNLTPHMNQNPATGNSR